MTQEELDKLAEKYQDDNTIIRYYGPGNGTVPEYNKTMAEVFKDGWNACREQMMKEAVEGEVEIGPVKKAISVKDPSGGDYWAFGNEVAKHFNIGDKVRIIIVKED